MGALKEKSPKAFRSISEASDILEVPQHVLRFWESKFGKLRPMKRAGGRRYYRPEDIALLHTIKELLYEQKYTIKGAQKLLSTKGIQPPLSDKAINAAGDTETSKAGNGINTPHTPSAKDSRDSQAALAALLRSAVNELKEIKSTL